MTHDVSQALAFYGHVVGWTSEAMPMEGHTYQVLKAGGRGMGGVMQLSTREMRAGWLGYVGAPDVDADLQRLERAGGTVQRPAMDIPHVGRFAPVCDPQGGAFLLFKPQPPPGEVPAAASGVGSVGWNELVTRDWEAAFAFYSELFGWTKGDTMDMGPMGTYQLFSVGAEPVGAMMNAPDASAPASWLYYFTVESVGAALKRVTEKGGVVTHGPFEVPGPMWTLQCKDPEGTPFALVSAKP